MKYLLTFIFLLFMSSYLFAVEVVSKIDKPIATISIVDVGQGDGILIQDFEGNKTVLIDAGKPSGEIVTFLKEQKINSINLFILTHPHADHIGSAKKVLQTFDIKKVLDSGYPHSSKMYKDVLEVIKEKNIAYSLGKSGQNIKIGENKKIKVLAPGDSYFSGTRSDANSNSVVFQLIVGDVKFMFTADSEAETENFVLENHDDIKSDVLKIAHHGGRHSTTDSFLEKVDPKVAVISVATENSYGHPSKEVLEKLKDKNIETHLTMNEGTIQIDTDGKNIAIRKSGFRSEQKEDDREEIEVIEKNDPDNFKEIKMTPVKLDGEGKPILNKDYFYSSKSSKIYYTYNCSGISKIKAKNLIEFKTVEDAEKTGRTLAKNCGGKPKIDDCGVPIDKKHKSCSETKNEEVKTEKENKSKQTSSGLININTATQKELMELKGIGKSTADKIIDYRKTKGNFKTIIDIKNVKGIGDKLFDKIKDQITVN